MLNIIFGKIDDVVYNTSLYFKNVFDSRWLEEADVKQMIKDIDKSEVLSSHAIDSPVLGIIPPTSLSGGVKALILINEIQDELFNASNCGDNCARWILEIAKHKDITINLRHIMDFGSRKFKARILNSGETVDNMADLIFKAHQYV